MERSLSRRFISKVREDGPLAATQTAAKWLANSHHRTFLGRAAAITNSYLVPNGWLNSAPQDADGYTPWFTYPAIAFLKDILSAEMRVFEYGSGYSTIFFNSRAKQVISVEHDPVWARRISDEYPDYDLRIRTLGSAPKVDFDKTLAGYKACQFEEATTGNRDNDIYHGLVNDDFAAYAAEIMTHPKGHFDIVVVDGMARLLTGYVAAQRVADNGLIILDNSDRSQYNSLHAYLIGEGFGRVDFWGPGPLNTYAWCTSFFSRGFSISNLRPKRPVSAAGARIR